MHLDYLFMRRDDMQHLFLQLGLLIISRGDGIHSDSHDDSVSFKHLHGYLSRQPMDIMRRHRVVDIDVQ